MTPSLWQILIVVALILILFGRNRISGFMGDLGKGISSFKKGLAEGKEGDNKKQVSGKSAPGAKKKTAAKSKK
ncbi:MAG: twin-arginine translocase TatA/TatE family subunit [Proteobacteria bacterium]|nr:twin-arginine translocase TatA/TatE family subunit [Pseudomonadota bacterium]